jgi:hypothetical protein
VKTYGRSLPRRAVESAVSLARPGTRLLLIADRLGHGAQQRAAALGVSVIGLRGEQGDAQARPRGHLAIEPGRVVALGEASQDEPPIKSDGGKPPWGSLTVIRALLLLGPLSQTQLAALADVSQPRVSQILAGLDAGHLIRRRPMRVNDWDRLLDHWLAHYPGPGGVQTHWHGLAPPGEQTRTVITLLDRHHHARDGELLVSGEVAADHLTPWGRTRRSVVYARHGEDLREAKLTPCLAQEATLTLAVPRDPGIWALAAQWWAAPGRKPQPASISLADPLQILTDVYRSPTVDADQTAQRLRHRLRQEVLAASGRCC